MGLKSVEAISHWQGALSPFEPTALYQRRYRVRLTSIITISLIVESGLNLLTLIKFLYNIGIKCAYSPQNKYFDNFDKML
jgi:hypothetical protein